MSTVRELRLALLARGISEKETIFFPVLVSVVEDESALFNATIQGLDERVIAMGISEDDAADNAIALFRDVVDTAIEQKLPLQSVLGSSPFKRSPVTLARASEILEKFAEVLETHLKPEDGWTRLDASPGFIPWAMLNDSEEVSA